MVELIALLFDLNFYNKYRKYININLLDKYSKTIIKYLDKYISKYNNTDIDKYIIYFYNISSSFKEEEIYNNIFNNIKDIVQKQKEDVKEKNNYVYEILNTQIAKDFCYKISAQALAGAESDIVPYEAIEEINHLLEEYNKLCLQISESDEWLEQRDIHDLVEQVAGGEGLNWRLKCLNLSLGPLRKGDLIIFSARPDTGKTTFLASESTYMAQQMPEGKKVLWLNNEEASGKVKWRVAQAALGLTTSQIKRNPLRVSEEYAKLFSGDKHKIMIFTPPALSVNDVEKIIQDVKEKHDIGLIIFDQLWKVHGFRKEAGQEVMRQTMLFQWARELAKQYAPVITVHQADGSAEGEQWIDMGKLYGSKTGIQGEADAIVTMGRKHTDGMEYSRFIYIPKNKLIGGENTKPELRNGRFEVTIQPEIARFKEPEYE